MHFGHLIARVPNPWLGILRKVLRRNQQGRKNIKSWATALETERATNVEKHLDFLEESFCEARLGTQEKNTLAVHLSKAFSIIVIVDTGVK